MFWYFGAFEFELLLFIIASGFLVTAELAIGPILLFIGILFVNSLSNHFGISSSIFDLSAFIGYISDNKTTILSYSLGYLCVGVVWSYIKWHSFTTKLANVGKKILEGFKLSYLSRSYTTKEDWFSSQFRNETHETYPVLASKHKNKIVTWMMYWPISILVTFCYDWIKDLFNFIYNKLSMFYQQLSDRNFSAITNELRKDKNLNEKSSL